MLEKEIHKKYEYYVFVDTLVSLCHHLKLLMCFRIVLIIDSACEFEDSRKSPITSETPPPGRPRWAFVANA